MPRAERKRPRQSAETASIASEEEAVANAISDVDMYSDEDLDGGFEDVEGEEEVAAPLQEEPSRTTAAHYAIPSLDEIHGLKETSDLYQNNVFKLQLDEMLKHTKPSMAHAGPMESALRELQATLQAIPAIEAQPLSAAKKVLEQRVGRSVIIPFCDPVPHQDPAYTFAFDKPSALNLVGSWPLKAAARRPGTMDVDVEVVMPSSLFQEKDTFNARYFYKRAFYMAVLAEHLHQVRETLSMQVEYLDLGGDRRRTCIVLRPERTKGDLDFTKLHAVIRIHLAHAPNTFPLARLAPNRNSLRGSQVDSAGEALPPTPIYNSCVVADSLRLAHLVFLHATSDMCPHFAEACQLLKTWAMQRGFGSLDATAPKYAARRVVAGTDDARFVLSMVLAHLLHGAPKGTPMRHKLAVGLSSVQLFRGTLDFLSKLATHVHMKAQPRFGLSASPIPPASFDVFERAFVDPSGSVNLFAHWPTSSVDALSREASQAMRMLNDGGDYFADLFLTPMCYAALQCDEVAQVRVSSKSLSALAQQDAGSARLAAMRRLLAIGTQALRQRAHGLIAYHAPHTSYALDAPCTPDGRVDVGVWLDAQHAWHQVDHGPSPDTPDASAFRAFWGDVAELRRFRDGRVLESVVWPVKNLAQRAALPRHILQYAWTFHACAKHVRFAGDAMQDLLERPTALTSRAFLQDPAVQGFQLVQSAYDTLVRELRAMDELPLSVLGVTPTAPALRSMNPMIPGPLNLGELGHTVPDVAAYLPVHDVLITMESSGQWPDDLAAIQEMKTALYERMAEVLPKRLAGATARVVYDTDATTQETIQDQTSLQVTMAHGFAFGLRIHHDREHVLLERLLRDAKARAPGVRALARYEARFVHAPTHHGALQALHDRYPALGPTVRLTRRWLAAQGLSCHVPVPAIELVCVAAFLSNAHAPPTTGVHGWVRVLDLLARWDWRETPLLIPLEHATRLAHQHKAAQSDDEARALPDGAAPTFPAAQRADAEQHFSTLRARDPAYKSMAWVLVTEMDITSKAWTRPAPTAMIADGIRQLAQRAMRVWEQAMPVRTSQVHVLFTPAWDAYDFVIHLNPSVHMRYAESLSPDATHWLAPRKKRAYANLEEAPLRPSVYGSEPRPGFDPVQEYVMLLQTLYPDICTLFYDDMGGTAIGGIWNAAYTSPHPFKVLQGYSAQPHAKGVRLNQAAILAEMKRLGDGLVERLEAS
ncbi:hypothetical protein Malapachy_2735 [Malassezia pachydermatis]|uniref:U3 small nucleolar RNA-associated protein 22 n=1 Tax=Malassezia pachydermatis TaxID=77020 RepID=A0A0M8MX00_9BASI|nr:hypothetical protein Malapachy_2735 [Malassezia pachydermatis]KOS15490.1 hypothetical protein Malapachy_2735 [Malassezia pachydermatis]